MLNHKDTIFALSSGRPPAAIAVVRVSGPHSRDVIVRLAGRLPQPRQALLARLADRHRESGTVPGSFEPIDDAVVLWFPGPRSETGEDTAEFQLHGGRAVVAALLSALGRMPGLRPAEPGEFTRRAFENGKLDLTRVEGLADLIGAETEAQRRQALRQLRGLLGERAERWRERLIEALALVEALIDFPDEGDVSEKLLQPALDIVRELEGEIRELLADTHRGERLREGLTAAVAGPVNVGKSSIVNRLAKRSAAIVSPYAGTTRDIIEVQLDLGGFPITILDTAGVRDTDDPVESEGVRRARARAEAADLVLWVTDATLKEPAMLPAALMGPDAPTVWVLSNKSDLIEGSPGDGGAAERHGARYLISAQTGAAFDELVGGLEAYAGEFFGGTESSLITRQRHRAVLQDCIEALRRAAVEGDLRREDMVAEELRSAARALGRLSGRVDVEHVLDVIFRDFCIGK
ncbi:MAG TPA: tRNA uridine-5-carboxymethylaminomethyl(34) synthesis GTPase MnmE [Xanthobacteraceae bacterium]|nr:tRNA uridine-5-carboxymethylaminomethyl(34) synthesis GTPase MnmE [Xanthobacteraceae bacterium]